LGQKNGVLAAAGHADHLLAVQLLAAHGGGLVDIVVLRLGKLKNETTN
jgi:hypothetical protein